MGFLYLLGLLLVAIPIIAIIALVKTITLGDQMRRIQVRLADLERALAAPPAGVGAPEPPRPLAPTIPPVAEPERPATTLPEPGPQPPPRPPEPEPASPVAATSPIAPPPGAAPARPQMSLEERLGTQWAVWVGGLALALGGIFLVRFSIEQGLLGPASASLSARCSRRR
jgi:uncharacterized membrane protein